MLNKSDVKEFCVRLAGEYPGWEYKVVFLKIKR